MRSPRAALLAFQLAASLSVSACGGAPPIAAQAAPVSTSSLPPPTSAPITITDDRGKTRVFAAPPARIVSLAPSATEIVFALGAGDRLVAVDDFSDYPAAAKALPKLGGFRTSPERIVAFQPDAILAITSGDLADQLDQRGQAIIVLDPVGLEGAYLNIQLIGALLGRRAAALELETQMRSRIGAVAQRAAAAATRPRVLHEVDSTNPVKIYVAGKGSFIDDVVRVAGGTNIAAASSLKYPQLSSEEIVRSDPEIIVLSDARFGTTVEQVVARPGYSAISAVRTKHIFPIDDDLVSRPGPRLVLGVEAYARLLHPEIFGSAP